MDGDLNPLVPADAVARPPEDRTTARRPKTPEEFLAIKGVGDKKAADLGPRFLTAIEQHDG